MCTGQACLCWAFEGQIDASDAVSAGSCKLQHPGLKVDHFLVHRLDSSVSVRLRQLLQLVLHFADLMDVQAMFQQVSITINCADV